MTKKMTRREALKTLGLAIGTVTASVSSVSGLTSCKEEKKRLIFYFTATGNSLFVARELGGKNVISIPKALKHQRILHLHRCWQSLRTLHRRPPRITSL